MILTIFRSFIERIFLTFSVHDEGVKNCNSKEQHPDHEGAKCKQGASVSASKKQTENLHLLPRQVLRRNFHQSD